MPGKPWVDHSKDFPPLPKKKTSMAEKYEKTKEGAIFWSKGLLQAGYAGAQWIKDKYQKTTPKR